MFTFFLNHFYFWRYLLYKTVYNQY